MLKIYDINIDEFREATQDDLDNLQIALNKLGSKDAIIKFISNLNSVKDQELIKEIYDLLTPYLHPDVKFTSFDNLSKTWLKANKVNTNA